MLVYGVLLVLPLAACATVADLGERMSGVPGLEVGGEVTIETTSVVTTTSVSASRYVAHFHLDADLRELARVPGRVLMDVGSNASNAAGDALSGSSTLAAEDSDQVNELFYERDLFDDGLRVRAGVLDGNAEFAAIEGAAGFFNPDASTTPTLASLPTWPLTAPGVEVIAGPVSPIGLAIGAYDLANLQPLATGDVPPSDSGAMLVGELRLAWPTELRGTTTAFGAFHDTGQAERLDGTVQVGFGGYYALAEHWLARSQSRRDQGDRGLRAFAVYGKTDAAVVRAHEHTALGAAWTGWWPGRPADEIGLMVSRKQLSRAAGIGGPVTALETYYSARLSDAAMVAVSIQLLDAPGDGASSSQMVLGIRGTFRL